MNKTTGGKKGLGALGEEKACEFLEGRGHRILQRNWRCGHLEIDIVSSDAKGLHFVEVKSRTAPVSASPEENVTVLKQKRIASAARRYLNMHGAVDAEVFFDVVSVVFDGFDAEVEFFPQAWLPLYI